MMDDQSPRTAKTVPPPSLIGNILGMADAKEPDPDATQITEQKTAFWCRIVVCAAPEDPLSLK